MPRMKTLKKGDVTTGVDAKKTVICEVVGSGNWTVQIRRTVAKRGRKRYRLAVRREGRRRQRGFSCRFEAADVLDLPKLTQVIAAALVADGWLQPGLRDDMACLADTLDWLLRRGGGRNGSSFVMVQRRAISEIVDYLWESERQHYFDCAPGERQGHVFRWLRQLEKALNREETAKDTKDVAVEFKRENSSC